MTVQKMAEGRRRVDNQIREKMRVWARLSRIEGMVQKKKKTFFQLNIYIIGGI